MNMVCGRCGMAGIYWRDLTGWAYTYCPHCEGINCQQEQEPEEDEEEQEQEVNK